MKAGAIFFLFFIAVQNLLAGNRQNAFDPAGEGMSCKGPELLFIENKGQIKGPDGSPRPDILFMLKSPGLTVFVQEHGLYYQFSQKNNHNTENHRAGSAGIFAGNTVAAQADWQLLEPGKSAQYSADQATIAEGFRTNAYQLSMQLLDPGSTTQVVGLRQTPYYEHYFNVPSRPEGIRNVASFERVMIKEVYPNIDWVLSVKEGKLKYDFIVRPGGRVEDIKMRYQGADKITAKEDGSMLISTPLGDLSEGSPFTYQPQDRHNEHENKAAESFIESSYKLLDAHTLGFEIGDYQQDKPLVIDPTVIWSTYYGGSELEYGTSTAIDEAGNVFLGGWTESPEAIADAGIQNTIAGNYDAFLVKFDAAGNRLWATYYGGAKDDKAYKIELDADENLYMCGGTQSEEGIAYTGFHNSLQGDEDAFLVKFNSGGERQWATYYGGAGFDSGHAIAVDAGNNIYLTGITESQTGIVSGGAFQNTFGGEYDAFLVKFNAAGQRQWGTYYGGEGKDNTLDGHKGLVAVDKLGDIYIAGWTSSTEAIASGGHQNTFSGSGDAFLAKFNPRGGRLWATYYGGEGFDSGRGIAVDSQNQVYLAGVTRSTTGIASGGFQESLGGHYDAFLAKFNEAGQRQWATYYGGSKQDEAKEGALCLDREDNVFLAGFTNSSSNIASCGFQDTHGGYFDAFVVGFNPEGRRRWASYFGGEGFEISFDANIDREGKLYMVGWTSSQLGISHEGFQNVYGGGGDAFLLKIDPFIETLEEPEIQVAGTMPLCPDQKVTLSIPAREGLSYAWSRDEVLMEEETGHSISTGEVGNYSVSITNGCDTAISEPIEVRSFEAAENPVITSSGALRFCQGESIRLRVAEEPGFHYQWLKDEQPVGENSYELVVRESGEYSVEATNNCGSLRAEAVVVEENTPPAPAVQGAAECGPSSLYLKAEGSSTAVYRWYENAGDTEAISGISGEAGETSAVFTTPVLAESKTYYVAAVEGNCESERVAVEAIIEPEIEAYAGEDTRLPPGEMLQLQANPEMGRYTYSWSPADGLDDPLIANPVANPAQTTTYKLTVTNENGCSATDEITIEVINEVFVPNAFSPNNDGLNDVWEIFNIEIFPRCKISVYNRWGTAVFESEAYEVPWDGYFQGKVLPSGSYAYIIHLDPDQKPMTGTVMVMP